MRSRAAAERGSTSRREAAARRDGELGVDLRALYIDVDS